MEIIHERQALALARENLSRPVLVPTMGNLHEGHLQLVKAAKKQNAPVIVSIFVNPLQFGPTEDFNRYPRTLLEDCEKLEEAGVDWVFAPSVETLYPRPQTCFVNPTAEIGLLEEKSRPGHFQGVATIVLKLFHLIQPVAAFFGKKDYQQLSMIRNMVEELNLPIHIEAIETARAEDGLALSSRNAYLSPTQRQEAPRLYHTLLAIRDKIAAGEENFDQLITEGVTSLSQHGWQVDYIAIRSQNELQLSALPQKPCVILGAAKLGDTRLIDNVEYPNDVNVRNTIW